MVMGNGRDVRLRRAKGAFDKFTLERGTFY